ncbi:MAG: ThiF family adenylyltransferase [Betaproteobacteria bacterium]|nr:ThiF family adenylyltransferase [Betaproteobacteria bacterium]
MHSLSRLGIGAFSLADPDVFELVNFNRQIGATMSTIGRAKTTVMAELVHGINPEADVRLFDDGIHAENIARFLDDVDVVVDSARLLLLPRNASCSIETPGRAGFGCSPRPRSASASPC